ncbi:MAG TPA: metallophosphoesterase [Acidimicrobiia bacterium]|nr:metallophosphoesterase [Acidimicrobiia bacterium]
MRRWHLLVGALFLGLAACGSSQSTPDDSSVDTARSFYPESSVTGSVLVIGDWGAGTAEQEEVASQMESYTGSNPVQAILTTGDNFYLDDTDQMLQPFRWAEEAGIEFWLTWGNHDVESNDRIEAVNEVFDTPPRWATIGWGETNILILDSTDVGSRAQLAYLEAEMERIEAPTIVVLHHPPYSCSAHVGDESVRDEWLSQFDEDVVLVLSGHAHNYQRFESDGLPLIVSGGGGQALQDLRACPAGHPALLVGQETFNFLILRQDTTSLTVIAVDRAGETIDEVAIPLGD